VLLGLDFNTNVLKSNDRLKRSVTHLLPQFLYLQFLVSGLSQDRLDVSLPVEFAYKLNQT